MTDETKGGVVIMTPTDVRRALHRMASQVVERHGGIETLAIIGVCTRGVPLAIRMADIIEEMEGESPPVGAVDVTFYRDDYATRAKSPDETTDLPFTVDGLDVVLVDDVLSTGRTTRAAIDCVMDFGRPRSIQLAALIDRGLRELPIMANYVGKTIQTGAGDKIRVRLEEVDGEDLVAFTHSTEKP